MPSASIAIRCPVCGAVLNDASVHCPSCGTDFAAATIGTGESPTLIRLKATEPLDSRILLEDLVGTLSPRFQGLRRLGQGGMGLVFIARDPQLKRDVAIKVLAPDFRDDRDARERFVREAQSAAAVAHPNVVSIYQVGELNATRIPYFVMQFIEGNPLDKEFPREIKANQAVARRIVAEVASALAAAHARGLVHRDIKPGNVMLDAATGRAIVLDFGIAASVQAHAEDEKLTVSGVYIGTPRYMSPEQASGEPVSDKSDMYSLGCLAYELATGHAVFEERNMMALFAAHVRGTPRPVEELRPDIDREFGALIMRCLEKDPARRPAASDVAGRLGPGEVSLLEWPPPGIEDLAGSLNVVVRRFATGSGLFALVGLLLILGGSRLPSPTTSLTMTVVYLLGAVSVGLLGRATFTLYQAARRAARAAKVGYGWNTIVELLSDHDGQSGDLFTGSRRFAALTPAQREAMRRGRVLRTLSRLLGAVSPVVGLFAIASLSGLRPPALVIVLVTLGVPLLGYAVAAGLERRERRAAPSAIVRREPLSVEARASRVSSWYEAFVRSTAGQGVTVESPRTSRTAFVAVGIAIAGTLYMMTAALGTGMILFTGSGSFSAMFVGTIMNSAARVQAVEFLRPLAYPVDSSITPIEAGRHLAAMYTPLVPASTISLRSIDSPPRIPWDSANLAPDMFATARLSTPSRRPNSRLILQAAIRGFSVSEVAWLQQVSDMDVWRHWNAVARAGAIDALGARVNLPFAVGANAADLPTIRFYQLLDLAYATVSRAALHLSRRGPDSARVALRSIVSVGVRLVDNANSVTDELFGSVIVGIGRDALATLDSLSPLPSDQALRARIDSARLFLNPQGEVADSLLALPSESPSLANLRSGTLRLATASSRRRGLRLSALHLLTLTPCTNARELLFGPSPEVADAFEKARAELIRFESDRELPNLIERSGSRPAELRHWVLPLPVRWMSAFAPLASPFIGEGRLEACAGMLVLKDLVNATQ